MSRAASLKMYRMLDDDNASCLNFTYEKMTFSYRKSNAFSGKPRAEHEWRNLKLVNIGSSKENMYSVEGDDAWDPDNCELHLKQEFTLENLKALFKTEKGKEALMPVALSDDVLGVAAVWWADKSRIRGCQEVGEFRYRDVAGSRTSRFSLDIEFPAGQLAGQLEVSYKLYLKAPGEGNLPGFARSSGTILGDLGTSLILRIDGEGAMFPVSVVNKPGEPLWWIEVNIDDPFEDSFTEEFFSLLLNEAHPDYKDTQGRNGAFSSLYLEAFACALEELFIVLKRDHGEKFDSVNINDVVPGTIAYAAIYMIKTFDIMMDSDITGLHNSIRKAVYKQLKGGL